MKKLLLCLFAVVALAVGAQAQTNPFIGKWKIARISTPQGVMNLEHKDSLKAFFVQAMKDGGGSLDSSQLAGMVDGMWASLGNMTIEFKADGTTDVSLGAGKEKKQGVYSVDVNKSTITQSEKKGQDEKTEPFKVMGDTIVIDSEDGKITLKKVK